MVMNFQSRIFRNWTLDPLLQHPGALLDSFCYVLWGERLNHRTTEQIIANRHEFLWIFLDLVYVVFKFYAPKI